MVTHPDWKRSSARVALVAALWILFAPFAIGQDESASRLGTLSLPQRTDAGNWYGTWGYVSRGEMVALWVREGADGLPEIKLRWQDAGSPAMFETDWSGRAEYETLTSHGRFSLALEERTPEVLRGNWTWETEGADGSRHRSSPVRAYRSGDGRATTLVFEKVTEIRRNGERERRREYPMLWGFTKLSKRLVRWEELPF